jgi:hypothetical protein
MAGPNWRPIKEAERGIGPLLLRAGSGNLDPVFVGYQADDGRWFGAADNSAEVHPTHFCQIPEFDCDDEAAV